MNIILAIGLIVAAIIITLVVSYILPKEKIKTANQLLEQKEHEQQLRIANLEKEYAEQLNEQNNSINNKKIEFEKLTLNLSQDYNDKLSELRQQENNLSTEIKGLEEKRNTIISSLEKEAQESGRIFKDQQLQIAKEQIEKQEKELQVDFERAKEQAKQEYLIVLTDLLAETNEKYDKTLILLDQEQTKLKEAKAKADAATESNRRAEMDRQQKDFYRLQLSEVDVEEIKKLRSVEPFLRDKEPLNKVIYKCYYEKPYTDLIGRIFNGAKPSGIYKITNLLNGMSYVGQSTNIPERWRQHIKRGVGAEPTTQNKLYPAMKEIGVENFMFEVLEKCSSADLSEREKFWTDFYQAQTYGYSVKKG